MDVLEQIKDIKLVPVVTFKNIEEVAPTLDALLAGDLKCAEICFRTECAKDAIKLAIKNYPNMLIGAGTVINKAQALDAIKLGVKFIVSPGFNVKENGAKKSYPALPFVALVGSFNSSYIT